jgi:hypothetical protein
VGIIAFPARPVLRHIDYIEKSDFETERGTRLTCIGAPKSDLVPDA